MSDMTAGPDPEPARRVVITGASSGIGLATAKQLAASGLEVVRVSRDRVRGQAAEARVAALATGPKPTFVAADLSVSEQLTNPGREIPQQVQEVIR
jgi:short-subunit dehydrogenase